MFKTKEQIEKELDNKFKSSSFCGCIEGDLNNAFPDGMNELKSFISQIRQDDIDSLVEWVKIRNIEGDFDSKTVEYIESGYYQARSDILAHLKTLKDKV
jgi:hypothetical protein